MGENELPIVDETPQPVSLEETQPKNEENLEPVEIVVKSNTEGHLQVINAVADGLYNSLNTEKICSVKNSILNLDPVFFDEDLENGIKSAKIKRDPSAEFTEKRVLDRSRIGREIEGTAKLREVSKDTIKCYGHDFVEYNPVNMRNVTELDDGKFLIHSFRPSESFCDSELPNLSFISEVPEIVFTKIERSDLNFDEGNFSVIYGDISTLEDGTIIFGVKPKEEAKHVLIKNYYYNDETVLPKNKAFYYENNIRVYDLNCLFEYGIYDKNFKNIVSEEDI